MKTLLTPLPRCALALRQCRHTSRPAPSLFLDFLAPSYQPSTISNNNNNNNNSNQIRFNSTSSQSSSSSNPPAKPRYILSNSQREYLDSALRVNQAGELAAVLICNAQTPQVVRSHPHLRPLMKHMHDQESSHFSIFNELIAKHRVRPTAMYPVWEAAATFLGWSTGALGREATMACTEAVETEIGSHYNEQVKEIMSWEREAESRGEELDPEVKGLLDGFRKIRDEELEHLDHALENDAKEAKPYDPLVDVIRFGCRAAIKVSEKV